MWLEYETCSLLGLIYFDGLGCAVINTGDLLEFWTKGLLPSTKHRVVIKVKDIVQDCGRNTDRYSFAYFW